VPSNYLTGSNVTASSGDARATYYTADQRAAYSKKQKNKPTPTLPQEPAGKKGGQPHADKPKGVVKPRLPYAEYIKTRAYKDKNSQERLQTVECFGCGEVGHRVRDCPNVQDVDEDDQEDDVEDVAAAVTKPKGKRGNSIVCKMVALNSAVSNRFLVALDSCAYTTVLCNDIFASDIVFGQCDPLLNWNGESHANEASAQFHPFGYCEINDKTPINLLSEFEVKSRFKFVEKFPEYIIFFVGSVEVKFNMDLDRRQYVVDWREYKDFFSYSPNTKMLGVVINSVQQNEAMFTKREVASAKEARVKIAHAGYMSKKDVMRLASSSGNVINWNLNRIDVQRAIDIYGSQHVLHGRSRIIRPDTRVVRSEPIPKRHQDLYTDKFYIGGLCFLICNAKPLDILFVKPLAGETEIHLGRAFQEFMAILSSYKFETDVIYSDADQAVIAQLNGHGRVRVETCAAGDHVNEAEARINTVKERFRSVKSGLNFELFKRIIIELVQYIVGRINICVSQLSVEGLCPRVRMTETLVDANKELNIGFGHLVVARNKNVKSNDAMEVRGEVCITLRAVGNRQGSWRVLKLVNGKIVVRSQFKEVPMTDLAKARLDELARMDKLGNPVGDDDDVDYDEPEDVMDDINYFDDLLDVTLDFPLSSVFLNPKIKKEVEVSDVMVDDEVIPPLEDVDSDDDDDDDAGYERKSVQLPKYSVKAMSANDSTFLTNAKDRAARVKGRQVNLIAGRRMSAKKRFNKSTSYVSAAGNFNISPKAGAKKYGAKRSLKSQYKEILSLYENGTFEGVLPKDLSGSRKRKVIRSFVLMREKFDAEGNFEKLKARLVANGAQMDPALFTDLSSPTVSLTFLLMMVTISARESREVATMDVGSAFVKASMDDEEEVLVVLDQLSAALLIKIDPSFAKFLNEKQEMTVKLKKALYGCLQSARLWFEMLVKELLHNGYEQNAVDPCVLNKVVNGLQSTILLHVDDMMVLSQIRGEARKLHAKLEEKFGKVTLHEGIKHNYLGMTFDFAEKGKVSISMLGYEQDLVRDWEELDLDVLSGGRKASAATPASNSIFEKGDSDMLHEKDAAIFHSYVMRVAYLAKRVKPQSSVSVSYLSTQVTKPNVDDLRKLDRAIRYVRDHLGEGITLSAAGTGKDVLVTGHIDASFGCHENGKSNTEVCVTLGEGPVFVRSMKQRIVTKSSIEAKLVALSDEVGLMFHIEDFVIAKGYACQIVIGQDNQSTIQMVTESNKESMRTRHINVRYFWLRERVKNKELTLMYVPTGNMLADILTKPMQGNLFRSFVRKFCCQRELVPVRN